jgi:hypothetical protein
MKNRAVNPKWTPSGFFPEKSKFFHIVRGSPRPRPRPNGINIALAGVLVPFHSDPFHQLLHTSA